MYHRGEVQEGIRAPPNLGKVNVKMQNFVAIKKSKLGCTWRISRGITPSPYLVMSSYAVCVPPTKFWSQHAILLVTKIWFEHTFLQSSHCMVLKLSEVFNTFLSLIQSWRYTVLKQNHTEKNRFTLMLLAPFSNYKEPARVTVTVRKLGGCCQPFNSKIMYFLALLYRTLCCWGKWKRERDI